MESPSALSYSIEAQEDSTSVEAPTTTTDSIEQIKSPTTTPEDTNHHVDHCFYEKQCHTAVNVNECDKPISSVQKDEEESSSDRSTVPTIRELSNDDDDDEIKEILNDILTIVIRDTCSVNKQTVEDELVSGSCENVPRDNLQICHRLVIRLNRIDESDGEERDKGASEDDARDTVFSNDQRISKECSSEGDESSEDCLLSPVVSRIEYTDRSIDEGKIEGRSPLKNRKIVVDRFEENEELRVESGGLSSGPTVVQKLDKDENYVSRNGVIARLQDNEEVVFSDSLIACMDDTKSLDVKQTNSFCTDEVLEMSNDTETETGSDSSEISSSVVNVRLEPCDSASDRGVVANQDKFFPCDEVNPEIINRLESERPEAFTEDSAESLTLAGGSRDEVRSDGSDSGLGSEIPGDSGAVPALESDSEISFLDRIPDEILTDKDKGEAYCCFMILSCRLQKNLLFYTQLVSECDVLSTLSNLLANYPDT